MLYLGEAPRLWRERVVRYMSAPMQVLWFLGSVSWPSCLEEISLLSGPKIRETVYGHNLICCQL
jgi:hypothetical protein